MNTLQQQQQQQRQHYRSLIDKLRTTLDRDGFVKIPPEIFCLEHHDEEEQDDKSSSSSAPSIEELRTESKLLFDGVYQTGIYPDEIHWRSGISRSDVTRELCNVWKSSLCVRRIVCSEVIGQLAADLMRWSTVRIGQDDLIHKPPPSLPQSTTETNTVQSGQDAVVGFHQDGTYISDNFVPRENNCLTVWIALDDADEEHGALQYAPGSHKWQSSIDDDAAQNVSASSFHVTADTDDGDDDDSEDPNGVKYPSHLRPLVEAARMAGKDPDDVLQSVQTVDVPAGQIVVHHQRTWHGSGPNRSRQNPPRPRRAVVAHLINGDVTWRTDPPPHYIYGRYYIRGETIPREDFFPILYTSSESSSSSAVQRTRWLDE